MHRPAYSPSSFTCVNRSRPIRRTAAVLLVTLIGVGVLSLLPALSAWGAEAPAAVRTLTFEGEAFTLSLRTDRIALGFAAGLSAADRDVAIARHELLATAASSIALPVPPITVFSLPEAVSLEQLGSALEALRTDPAIAFVNRVYRSGGIDLIDSGELFVQLRAPEDEGWLRDRAAALGCEVVSATAWRAGNFLLRVTRESVQDAIAAAETLAADPQVEYATPNLIRRLRPYAVPSDPLFGSQWALHNTGAPWAEDDDVDAPEGWEIRSGSAGVTIAIIDEGCDMTHPDYAASLVGGWDFPGNDADPTPNPWDGHGTSCAGVAAALTDNGLGVAGVAGGASIMPIRIAYSPAPDSGWVTTDLWLSDAIAWAYMNGADVLSNSWGGGPPSAQIHAAIRDAVALGRGGLGSVVVCATGNDNQPVPSYPALHPEAIAVAATSPCDERKNPASCDGENWGSNYGPGTDVAAPGVKIPTTDIQGSGGYNSTGGAAGDYFMTFNGTSAATPHVAGVAALLLLEYPAYQGTEIRARIEQTCDKVGGYGYDPVTGISGELGHGRVNLYRALSGKPQVAEGPLPAKPSSYRDDGDAWSSYSNAHHESAAYEWLGEEYSPEKGLGDAEDPDGPPNQDQRDAFDDGVFFSPPYIPGQTGTVVIHVSVENSQSTRYANGPLYLNLWFDWEEDDDWNNTHDWVVQNHIVDPSTWGPANQQDITISFIVPSDPISWHIGRHGDDHFLNIRTRLTYDQTLNSATQVADWGEVEDDYFLNFVEMFAQTPGYIGMFQNCLAWNYYDGLNQPWTCHPPGFTPDDGPNGYMCAEVYSPSYLGDEFAALRTPGFDLSEFTTAHLRFEHAGVEMATGYVNLYKNGVFEASLRMYFDPLPLAPCAPVLTDIVDLTPWCGDGNDDLTIEFTTFWGEPCGTALPNYQDWKIDNIVIVGTDDIVPDAVLATVAPTGPTSAAVTWTAPGDDGGARQAELYNIRYAPDPITPANWRHALWVRPDMAGPLPTPGPPGTAEFVNVQRLSSGQHHFAVRTLDEVNWIGGIVDGGANQAPSVTAPESIVAQAGDVLAFDISATDPDFDLLMLRAPQRPAGAEFTDHGNGTGTLVWATDNGDVGAHTVVFEARDWNGATGQDTTVIEIQTAPGATPDEPTVVHLTRLTAARPAVFRDQTAVHFELARAAPVNLAVYDVTGREVRELIAGPRDAGPHAIVWDGRDARGRQLGGGIYLLRLQLPGQTETRPVVMIR